MPRKKQAGQLTPGDALTEKEKAFAVARSRGKTLYESHQLAGYKQLAKRDQNEAHAHQIQNRPHVAKYISEIRENEYIKEAMSYAEKRAYLARVKRTPVGEVDETSDLAQEVKYEEGPNGSRKTVKMVSKQAAIEIDNRMAGHDFKDHPTGQNNPFLMLVGICGNSRDDEIQNIQTIEAETAKSDD